MYTYFATDIQNKVAPNIQHSAYLAGDQVIQIPWYSTNWIMKIKWDQNIKFSWNDFFWIHKK